MESSQDPTFLGLPKSIRAKILRTAGLRRSCPIGLIDEKQRVRRLSPNQLQNGCVGNFYVQRLNFPACLMCPREWCTHEAVPVRLFQVCSQLKKEAEDIFYKESSFYVKFVRSREIPVLRGIACLGSIRRLTVYGNRPRGTFDQVCTILAQRLKPRVTFLNVEFTMGTLDEVKRVVLNPLISAQLPQLSAVRFTGVERSFSRDDRLDRLEALFPTLKRSADILIGGEKTRSCPSFMLPHLPIELQTMVLSHTSLVSRPERYHGGDNRIPITGANWARRTRRPGRFSAINCIECWHVAYSSLCGCQVMNALIEPNGVYVGDGAVVQELARMLFFGRNSFHLRGSVKECIEDLSNFSSGVLKWMRDITVEFCWDQPGENRQSMTDLIRVLEDRLVHPLAKIKFHFKSPFIMRSNRVWGHQTIMAHMHRGLKVFTNKDWDEWSHVIRDTIIESKLRRVEFVREKLEGSQWVGLETVYERK